VFAWSGLGGGNDVSRVKRGRWNKNVWETLLYMDLKWQPTDHANQNDRKVVEGPKTVVPKLGVNYPLGVICDSSGVNAKPKPHCCSVLWAITAKEIFNLKCEKFLLREIRHNRYLDLGNGSDRFWNHWPKTFLPWQLTPRVRTKVIWFDVSPS